MSEEHMDFLLSTVTDFEEMEKKEFSLKKCDTICPRIAALKESFGFGPEEPLNAENLHHIIPATKNIRLILNKKKKNMTPMPKMQSGKVPTSQNQFRPGSSRMSGVNSRVHTPKITNGINSRSSTPKSATNSIQKVSTSHDVVGEILKRASTTTLSSRFSAPNTSKSSIAKHKVHTSKNPALEPSSSQESGISTSADDSESGPEKENKIPDLRF